MRFEKLTEEELANLSADQLAEYSLRLKKYNSTKKIKNWESKSLTEKEE